MTAFEVVLLLCGIICVVVSFIMGDSGKDNTSADIITSKLTEEQKSDIRRQINEIVEEEVQNVSEKTEVSLDKISNTKILEMNEYAENVLGQINRNHNETVFLYDMLNDKAKEVKTTVKDINTAKRQVERIQAEVAAIDSSMKARIESGTEQLSTAEQPSKPEQPSRVVQPPKTEPVSKAEKADKADKTDKADKSDNTVKEKEFRLMTPSIVKEVDTQESDIDIKEAEAARTSKTAAQSAAAQPAAKKPRQSSKKSAAASDSAASSAASSGNVAKERLRRVVAKEEEAAPKEKAQKSKEQNKTQQDTAQQASGQQGPAETNTNEQSLSEEDRMDAAIIKAGGTGAKTAKTKSTARKTAKKTQTAVKQEPPKEVADMNIQFESGSNNNETILKMYKSGKNNKEIAKELNLGVGEVKLVIDLYNSTK